MHKKSYIKKEVETIFHFTLNDKNIRQDKTGTKVPISGRIENPDIGIISTIINIFRNAFIEDYKAEVDHTISLRDLANDEEEKSFQEKLKEAFTDVEDLKH